MDLKVRKVAFPFHPELYNVCGPVGEEVMGARIVALASLVKDNC